MISRASITFPDKPAWNKLRVRVDCRPCPNVAMTFGFLLYSRVLFLAANKSPRFIGLKATAFQIAKNFVLIVRARFASRAKKFHDGIDCGVGQSRSRSNRISFAKAMQDLRSF